MTPETETASALSGWLEQLPTMSTPVVRRRNALEFLLASSVPAVRHVLRMSGQAQGTSRLHGDSASTQSLTFAERKARQKSQTSQSQSPLLWWPCSLSQTHLYKI